MYGWIMKMWTLPINAHTLIDTILFSHKKGNIFIGKIMNRNWWQYKKWNKSHRQRQILYDFIYTQNLKTTISSPPKKQKQTHINRMCVFVYSVVSTLCDLMDCNPPGSSVHGIFQTIILEWVVIFSSRWSQPKGWTRVSCISCIGRQILNYFTTWEAPETE